MNIIEETIDHVVSRDRPRDDMGQTKKKLYCKRGGSKPSSIR
jgi:hypothetical protein